MGLSTEYAAREAALCRVTMARARDDERKMGRRAAKEPKIIEAAEETDRNVLLEIAIQRRRIDLDERLQAPVSARPEQTNKR